MSEQYKRWDSFAVAAQQLLYVTRLFLAALACTGFTQIHSELQQRCIHELSRSHLELETGL